MNLRRGRALFVVCYVASGTAALVYQVAWTRLFTLELGHTVAASSTVLAAFMGGLAIGAWLAGRASIPIGQCLRIYAALEIAVAVVAVMLPTFLHATTPLLAWAYADGSHHTAFALVRVALSVALLGIPAAAMGATFPIASTWIAARAGSAADAGMLYGANSAGAAAGAIGAGFWLIPAVGLRGTVFIGVALNIAAAAGALWLARHDTSVEAPPPPKRQARAMHTDPHVRDWPQPAPCCRDSLRSCTRSHGLVSSRSSLDRRRMRSRRWWRRSSAALPLAHSPAHASRDERHSRACGWRPCSRRHRPSAVIAAWFAASRLPLVLAHDVGAGAGFVSLLARELLYIAVLLLPTSIASGAAFPLALATARSETATVGRDVARIYAANTVGAVSGALAAGFVIIPRLGVQSTFEWMSRIGTAGAVLLAVTLLAAHTTTRPSWSHAHGCAGDSRSPADGGG